MNVVLEACDVCRIVDYCTEVNGLIVCSNCIQKLKEEEKDNSSEELYKNQTSIFDYL